MNEGRQVVMDTSTLVGAVLRPDSIPRQAFLTAIGSYELCVSAASLNELQEVLQRRKFDRYAPLQERQNFLTLLTRRSTLCAVDAVSARAASGACRDAKDDKFLALALACQAVALVTSDGDLTALHPWRDIQILTPAAFVAMAQT